MKRFFRDLRRRLRQGIRLSRREHATLEGVHKRIRRAVRKGKGIRLTHEELRVLGIYGLKEERDQERPEWDD